MNDALALGTLSKDSVSAEAQALSILSSQNTLATYKEQRLVAVTQFASLTGMQYDGVDAIDTPAPAFTPSADGNTAVKLKKEALAIAQEDLGIKKAEETNATLSLNGSSSWAVVKNGQNDTASSGAVSLGASLAKQTFSVGLSAGMSGIGSSTGSSPYVSINGSWNNNASKKSDQLELLQLQNDVLLAQLEYATAMTDYQSSAASLQKSISAWKLEHARLQRQKTYEEQSLAYETTLRTQGLATDEDVKDAQLQLELVAYDLSISSLNGLILQNSIASLNL